MSGQVLAPKHAGAQGEGFARAPVMAEVSLLPAGPSQGAVGEAGCTCVTHGVH